MAQDRLSAIEAWRINIGLSVPQATRALSEIVGAPVPVQTWYAWERRRRGPKTDKLVIALYRLTGGQVRPDHSYDLPELPPPAATAP